MDKQKQNAAKGLLTLSGQYPYRPESEKNAATSMLQFSGHPAYNPPPKVGIQPMANIGPKLWNPYKGRWNTPFVVQDPKPNPWAHMGTPMQRKSRRSKRKNRKTRRGRRRN